MPNLFVSYAYSERTMGEDLPWQFSWRLFLIRGAPCNAHEVEVLIKDLGERHHLNSTRIVPISWQVVKHA